MASLLRRFYYERKSKRRRIDAPGAAAPTASFDFLNNDCVVNILAYLHIEEMDTVAMCSRACREARSNKSLDQTRTGIIKCRENTSIAVFIRTITDNGWNKDFAGTAFTENRTRLKIEGFERLSRAPLTLTNARGRAHRALLDGVTSLDLSLAPQAINRTVKYIPLKTIARILPNLEELNLSYVEIEDGSESAILSKFSENFPGVRSLTWEGAHGSIDVYGFNLRNSNMLTKLYIDGAHIYLSRESSRRARRLADDGRRFLFCLCSRPSLEQVSIRGVTTEEEGAIAPQPLGQERIIKFVRNTPSLRWLRSDLTQERPEVTFVSD